MDIQTSEYLSETERSARSEIAGIFRDCPIPEGELLANLGLFLSRPTLSRILFMDEVYRRIVDVHGIVMEFGCRWGQNLALFESFRGLYEPYNHTRRIVGFDTFAGFASTSAADGSAAIIGEGSYAVTPGYEEYLAKVLDYHEQESPVSHIRKYELVKGDAVETVEQYLERHPETIVALAYFDFDLYEPTKRCLTAIRDRLTKGSVLAFDELLSPEYPGETLALKEVIGLDRWSIRRSSINSYPAYVVVD
jgi:hypothetical protein